MRLFIAIQFTDRIKKALSYLQQDMRDCGLKGNYTRDENLHLTLAFIGEYGNPDEVLDALDSLDFEPFLLELPAGFLRQSSPHNSSQEGIIFGKS